MKYITKENYKEFKPSEFVHSFVSDIDVAIKSGKPMNMGWYVELGDCLPCLGGMACMNLGITSIPYSEYGLYNGIANLGNEIRKGRKKIVTYRLSSLYDDVLTDTIFDNLNTTDFRGKIETKKQFKALKAQVMKYVIALEKAGY